MGFLPVSSDYRGQSSCGSSSPPLAYVLVCALCRIGLARTQFAEATCGTIRLKLFKIGALVTISVRRVKVAMASACRALRCRERQRQCFGRISRPTWAC